MRRERKNEDEQEDDEIGDDDEVHGFLLIRARPRQSRLRAWSENLFRSPSARGCGRYEPRISMRLGAPASVSYSRRMTATSLRSWRRGTMSGRSAGVGREEIPSMPTHRRSPSSEAIASPAG